MFESVLKHFHMTPYMYFNLFQNAYKHQKDKEPEQSLLTELLCKFGYIVIKYDE